MTKIDITEYKAGWEARARRETAENEAARVQAIEVAQRLSEVLARNYPVKKIILYGSVIEPGRFKKTSDIDMAVEGLPKGSLFEATALLLEASPFEIDLKPLEDVSELLRQKMAKGKDPPSVKGDFNFPPLKGEAWGILKRCLPHQSLIIQQHYTRRRRVV